MRCGVNDPLAWRGRIRQPGARRSISLAAALSLFYWGCAPASPAPETDEPSDVWSAGPPLPTPITNNAVAAVETTEGISVFSFLGLDASKKWSGVTNAAFRWNVGEAAWREIEPVPGPGRLASTAQVIDGLIYVVGGYTVAEDGTERSVPDVNVYDPVAESWSRAPDIPVPTDDAVAGVWRGTHIVLVSGWHDDGNVPDVQLFEPASGRWTSGTPIPGNPVFGHTGAVVGDRIVYVDGTVMSDVAPRFSIEASSWEGVLDGSDPTHISWTRVAQHPGPPLYRAGGASVGNFALFAGGADNPYNYDGLGYDGVPSQPLRQLLAWGPGASAWRYLPAPPIASMDHRNLGTAASRVFLVGGMIANQEVTARVWMADIEALFASVF
ncbi:MAG: hypothetical protein O2958_02605 [Gemmatimonadetes bacterium]|nr:hypothetical protein [Gemmatimonadota bacterium]MDA1102003.1 hypothetical protein [Gemmatimonadota bacterium]